MTNQGSSTPAVVRALRSAASAERLAAFAAILVDSQDRREDGNNESRNSRQVIVPSIDYAADRAPKGDYFAGGAVFLMTLLAFSRLAALLEYLMARNKGS